MTLIGNRWVTQMSNWQPVAATPDDWEQVYNTMRFATNIHHLVYGKSSYIPHAKAKQVWWVPNKGLIYFKKRLDDAYIIKTISVVPAFRDQGIGRALINIVPFPKMVYLRPNDPIRFFMRVGLFPESPLWGPERRVGSSVYVGRFHHDCQFCKLIQERSLEKYNEIFQIGKCEERESLIFSPYHGSSRAVAKAVSQGVLEGIGKHRTELLTPSFCNEHIHFHL